MSKCPICNGKFRTIFDVNYDEPPECLTQCNDCGFTEYYFYYEGYTTSIRSCKFNDENKSYEDLHICIIHKNNEFIDIEEYKSILNEELKKLGITLDDLIRMNKEKKTFLENRMKEHKQKEVDDKVRWENGDYTQNELLEINQFLEKEVIKIKTLEQEGLISKLKLEHNAQGLLVNIAFEINEQKAESYEAKKENAQVDYAISISAPMFAPKNCFKCYTRIFSVKKENKVLFGKPYETIKEYMSFERCSTTLITGCPNCNRSYVD